jgi:hypothetical protein
MSRLLGLSLLSSLSFLAVTQAQAADTLGMATVMTIFVTSIRAVGAVVFLGACVWKGMEILIHHRLDNWMEALLVLGVGGALIVAAPQIAGAVVTGSLGAAFTPLPPWAWNELVGDTIGGGLIVLLSWVLPFCWWRHIQAVARG